MALSRAGEEFRPWDRPLGRGRLGDSWPADGPDGRRVVMKRLVGLAPAAADADTLFSRAAAVGVAVAPLTSFPRAGDLWVVYPFVDGLGPVAAATTHGPSLCSDLARAVASVHDAGLVHGAVSDSNTRVTPAGEVLLLEVGLATLGADLDSEASVAAARAGDVRPCSRS